MSQYDLPVPQPLSNRLGALALGIVDHQALFMSQAAHLPPGRAAAIVSVGVDPGIGATALGHVLGITQSVATRLADDLAAGGLLTKRPGRTGRDVALHLTAAGEALRARILWARADALAGMLGRLDAEEQEIAARLVDKLLTMLTSDRRQADHICRLCDEAACGLAECPVERAAADAAL